MHDIKDKHVKKDILLILSEVGNWDSEAHYKWLIMINEIKMIVMSCVVSSRVGC